MPQKEGPRGTWRYYSPSTGRYARHPTEVEIPKKHLSKKEKLQLRREVMLKRAMQSNDKYLLEVFLEVDKHFPGKIKHINEFFYDRNLPKTTNRTREIDMIVSNSVIEIKSGSCRHKSQQFKSQETFCKQHNLKYIIFAPNIGSKMKTVLRAKGYTVIESLDNLIKEIK